VIVTIGNSKGGVGKSTIACNLAVMAAKTGKNVLLVDADPQASSLNFRSIRESDDIKATAITTPTLHKDLKDFSNFDMILIDSGGRDTSIFRSAILAADLLVIPVLPSVYDIWAASDTIEIVKEAVLYNEKLVSRFLINMVLPNSIMGRDTQAALKEHEEIPILKQTVGARQVFKNALSMGQGVVEFEPKSKAAQEIAACYQEIIELGTY
jgi:chromosome partitioning protein